MVDAFDGSIVEQIEMRMVRPSRFPVRYGISEPELAGLRASIREQGLFQPIVVRPLEHGFEIVAGHRRFSACKGLRWRFIPCRIRELTDRQAFEVQLTENVQRKSMDPLEEAEAFHRYVVEYGWGGAADLARRIGKSGEYVSHRMQLLRLSEDVKEKVASCRLGISQALEVASMDPASASKMADEIVEGNLTVRQVRRLKEAGPVECGYKKEPRSREELILQRNVLALKVALSRIDDLVEDAHKAPPARRAGLVEFLMGQRREIHSMIDDSIHQKKASRSRGSTCR